MNKPTSEKNSKICRECGCVIQEQVESPLFECERCLNKRSE
ncbi:MULTISPECIES: YhfH family protein [Psychrobacillus]|nr:MULTISPECIES: YhfH family protein [Psychrobacillus]